MLTEAREIIKDCALDFDEVPHRQPFKLALIEEFQRISGDLDFRAFYSGSSFRHGVAVGVDCKLPRTPAVFEGKVKQKDYTGQQLPDVVLRSNYPTAEENAAALEKTFWKRRNVAPW